MTKKILITIGVIALISYLVWAYNKAKFPFSNKDAANSNAGFHTITTPSEIIVTTDEAPIYSRVTVRYDVYGNIITDKNKPADKTADIIIRTGRNAKIGTTYSTNGIEFLVGKDGLTYQYYSLGSTKGGDYIFKDDANVTKTESHLEPNEMS